MKWLCTIYNSMCASPKKITPNSKVHSANMGSTYGQQDPGVPHVGHMNLAAWDISTPVTGAVNQITANYQSRFLMSVYFDQDSTPLWQEHKKNMNVGYFTTTVYSSKVSLHLLILRAISKTHIFSEDFDGIS